MDFYLPVKDTILNEIIIYFHSLILKIKTNTKLQKSKK